MWMFYWCVLVWIEEQVWGWIEVLVEIEQVYYVVCVGVV